MQKRIIILVTFLAYSLTLVHSLVPHHHHEVAGIDHHHHGDRTHHHHDDDDRDNETINHAFADAVHHPSSAVYVQASESKVIQKKTIAVDILIVKLSDLLSPELKPPDARSVYQENCHSSAQDLLFLLRAPPAA